MDRCGAIMCLVTTPTRTVQPALGKPLLWRMISSLSLNHLSLTDGTPDALRELLRLHNVSDALSAERQIDGLTAVRSTPAFARVAAPHGITFARGRRVELEFDEEQFPGGGMFLFASVLERFLALYASHEQLHAGGRAVAPAPASGGGVAGARRLADVAVRCP